MLGSERDLPRIVSTLNVDRVFIAYSRAPDAETLALVPGLVAAGVVVDVVPRLFDAVHPGAAVRTIEDQVLCVGFDAGQTFHQERVDA